MRKVRIAGLGAVAALVVVGLFQLPASPFDRHDLPDRSPSVAADSDPLGDPSTRDGDPTGDPAGDGTPNRQATAGANEPGPADNKPGAAENTPGSPTADPVITYPQRGSVSYTVLPGAPETIGTAGRLLTFEIDLENGIKGINPAELSRFVRTTYGAPLGWTAGGKWRFRQVGPGQNPDFKLMFVTPATRDLICGGGYDHYTSCRIGERVVLNIARWVHGVPNYGASLTEYRQYMLNHETGHRLGEAHELCPGPGQPAPVMQQQTLGLHGCIAYAWPYRNGRRYEGRLGKYNDPIPAS
ncbi:DUF3152 domain-containing protein [Kribbella sp. CA-253562]|uniref:DUF3152 domain-containing protein n=1 Tax=Kribbella sp. CA-253562 TaxID=3239942 RepID=UPI003D90C4BC